MKTDAVESEPDPFMEFGFTRQEMVDRYVTPAIEAAKRGSYPPFMTAYGAAMADLTYGPWRVEQGLPFHGVFTHGGPHS